MVTRALPITGQINDRARTALNLLRSQNIRYWPPGHRGIHGDEYRWPDSRCCGHLK